jgi:hypothetical protein
MLHAEQFVPKLKQKNALGRIVICIGIILAQVSASKGELYTFKLKTYDHFRTGT